MKRHFALAALAFVPVFSIAADTGNPPAQCSLIVAETQPGKNVATPQLLVRYRLEDGKLKDREVLATSDGARYEFGGNRIYLDQYVITRGGDIFDLEAKKFLPENDRGYESIACEDGKVILYRSNDQGFYCYDLKAGQFAKMDDPGKWALLLKPLALSRTAELSPDGTKSVVDATITNTAPSAGKSKPSVFGSAADSEIEMGAGKLTLFVLHEKPRTLGAGFVCKVSLKSSELPQTPVLWLDNERILTQRGNGKLVILKLDGSVEPVADIEIQGLPLTMSFFRDPAGRIIYTCGDSYVIDPDKKSFAKMEWQAAGNGFEVEVDKTSATSRVRYMGKEIGFESLDPSTARTTPGMIAVAPAKANSADQREIRVWNSATKSWVSLELGGQLIDIIGWLADRDAVHPANN